MTKLALQIRSFRDDDHDAVVQLWQVCFADDPPRNAPSIVIRRKLQVQRDLFVVGVVDGRIVATAMAGYDGYRGWVYHVATAPEMRRQGIGRQMMRHVESSLRRLGCPKLNLQVRATNRTVIDFYNSLGYSVEDRVSMGKTLDDSN